MARRVRQHVNPLSVTYMEVRAEPVSVPDHLGPDPRTEVELGCADGQFALSLARANPTWWVVGLDIRDKVLEANRRQAAEAGLRNLHFAYVNLNVDLERVFGPGSVHRFHLMFPDPWFKSRHHKRRVVDGAFLEVIARQLRDGGELHLATDVFEIALDAMAELETPHARELGFRNVGSEWSFWRGNPFGARSRREDKTRLRGERVWRLRYVAGP